jgi:hypothetical protein
VNSSSELKSQEQRSITTLFSDSLAGNEEQCENKEDFVHFEDENKKMAQGGVCKSSKGRGEIKHRRSGDKERKNQNESQHSSIVKTKMGHSSTPKFSSGAFVCAQDSVGSCSMAILHTLEVERPVRSPFSFGWTKQEREANFTNWAKLYPQQQQQRQKSNHAYPHPTTPIITSITSPNSGTEIKNTLHELLPSRPTSSRGRRPSTKRNLGEKFEKEDSARIAQANTQSWVSQLLISLPISQRRIFNR